MPSFKVLVLLSVFAIALSVVESSPVEAVTEVQELYESGYDDTYSPEPNLPTETEVGEQTEELSRQKRSCYTAQVRTRSGRIISVRRCNG